MKIKQLEIELNHLLASTTPITTITTIDASTTTMNASTTTNDASTTTNDASTTTSDASTATNDASTTYNMTLALSDALTMTDVDNYDVLSTNMKNKKDNNNNDNNNNNNNKNDDDIIINAATASKDNISNSYNHYDVNGDFNGDIRYDNRNNNDEIVRKLTVRLRAYHLYVNSIYHHYQNYRNKYDYYHHNYLMIKNKHQG
jgi:hypothetical protein